LFDPLNKVLEVFHALQMNVVIRQGHPDAAPSSLEEPGHEDHNESRDNFCRKRDEVLGGRMIALSMGIGHPRKAKQPGELVKLLPELHVLRWRIVVSAFEFKANVFLLHDAPSFASVDQPDNWMTISKMAWSGGTLGVHVEHFVTLNKLTSIPAMRHAALAATCNLGGLRHTSRKRCAAVR
jgi:hypothetical protein